MKQLLTVFFLMIIVCLSGCSSATPRMTWFKQPFWKKQDTTKLAENEKPEHQEKKINPFKRNKKNESGIILASEEQAEKKKQSEIELLINKELIDATEAEREQMKSDLKGRDIAMVRSVLNVWKNVRRTQNRKSDHLEIQQASTNFPITSAKQSLTPQKTDHQFQQPADTLDPQQQFLLASNEKQTNRKTDTIDLRSQSGLGRTNPWGDSPFDRNAKQPIRTHHDQSSGNLNRQQPGSQIIAGHSTDTIFNPNEFAQPKRSLSQKENSFDENNRTQFPGTQPVDHREQQPIGMAESFNVTNNNHRETTQLPAGNQGADARMRHLENLIALTEDQLVTMKQNPNANLSAEEQQRQYVEKQVYLRMLYLMTGEQVRSFDTIPGIPAADQEFWRQLFWGMANYFDHAAMPDARTRATQTVAQLQQATLRLQANANLQLRNLNFCHKISSFGNYETFKQAEFRPGQRVLLYSEVQNFKSTPSDNGKFYRTMLKSHITIHRAGNAGGTVAEFQFDPAEDLCRNYRKDYFHSYEIAIPDNITLGPHVVTLTVTDQLGDKIATETLKFNVK